MCGICGKVSYNGEPVTEELLRKMCSPMASRGPDDEGFYSGGAKGAAIGLAHKRLSIIDLSTAGRQPMANEDGTVWITYNGEIYNYDGLREELVQKGHIFKSDSDTEIILHLYEEEGTEAVKRINGMFAFAIWDERAARLWLCRDRVGIKPLVYYWDAGHFGFASEIKALLQDPQISKSLDHEALYLYLTFSYVPAPHTIFKGINKLKPGHSLVLEQGNIKIESYWDVPPQDESTAIAALPFPERKQYYQERLFKELSGAVGDRMIADVPLGAFLSGGIDSSIIVALMARRSAAPVKTFSIGFKDLKLYDETPYAREVAEMYSTDHYEFQLTSQDMLDALPAVLSTFDEPFSDSSALPTYIVSKETRKHVTVALSGDGGDELFAGYRCYQAQYWHDRYMMVPALLREGLFETIINFLPDSRNNKFLEYVRRMKKFIRSTKGSFPERVLSLKEIFPAATREAVLCGSNHGLASFGRDPALQLVEELLAAYPGDRLNSVLYSDLKDSLPGDMLTKVDWMSMQNSLEVRVPLLDYRVVELAFEMAADLKLHKGTTKYILKETFRDILPASLYSRPKAGFEVPISHWLKTDLKFLLDDYLGAERINRQGIFDHQAIQGLISDHLGNKTDTSWLLWNLIVFQHWYDAYFQG